MLSSDDKEFGGHGRLDHATEHFTHPEGNPGDSQAVRNHTCRSLSFLQGVVFSIKAPKLSVLSVLSRMLQRT